MLGDPALQPGGVLRLLRGGLGNLQREHCPGDPLGRRPLHGFEVIDNNLGICSAVAEFSLFADLLCGTFSVETRHRLLRGDLRDDTVLLLGTCGTCIAQGL